MTVRRTPRQPLVSLNVASVNDAPIAYGTGMFGFEDGVINGFLDGDDVDGDALIFEVVDSPDHGTLTMNPNGTGMQYRPAANYNGPDGFTFRTYDGQAYSAIATGIIDIAPVNDAPTATAASFVTNEDTPLNGSVTGGDIDGDGLTFALATGPAHGSVIVNPDGTFTYTPDANYHGSDSFTFRASDGTANSAPALVDIDVASVNDGPTANASSFGGTEDTALNGVLTGGDIDGDGLTFSLATGPAHGAVVINPDGTFTYTPAANYNGPDSFSFRTNDGTANSAPATVTLNLAAVNDAPTATPAAFGGIEDTPAAGVLAGTDADGDGLTFSLVTAPAHGSVVVNPNGSFTYTPQANYNGPDSFTFRTNDGQANSAPALVSLSIANVNDAPTSLALAGGTVAENVNTTNAVTVGTLSASDVDGTPLTFTFVTGSGSTDNARFQIVGNQLQLRPGQVVDFETKPNYSVRVQVSDGQASIEQVFVIQVINDPGAPGIDVRPGTSQNVINIRNGTVEVAILSSREFDAATQIDINSLTFGRFGTESSLVRKKGAIQYRLADVNGDGFLDLIVTANGNQTGLRVGDTQAILRGRLTNGTTFQLTDTVIVTR